MKEPKKNLQIKQYYQDLQESLDALTADFIQDTGEMPGKTTVLDFMKWLEKQTKKTDQRHHKRLG